MKPRYRHAAWLGFCLLSGLAAWAAGRADRPQPAPTRPAGPVRSVMMKPPDPAWLAAAAPDFSWPAADLPLIEEALRNPLRASPAVYAQIMGLPEDSAPLLRGWILKLRGRPGRADLISVLMTRLTAISPQESLEFALTLPPADASAALVAGLPAWTRTAPTAALSWCMAKYWDGQISTAATTCISSIAWQWGRQDLPGAFTFIKGLEAMIGGRANGAVRELCTGIGGLALQEHRRQSVLEQGFEFAATRTEHREVFEAALLSPLSQEKPASLAAWLDSQPARTVPDAVIHAMLTNWSAADPGAALRWIQITARPVPDDLKAKIESSARRGM